MLKTISKSPKTKLSPALFWHSVSILITKPHVVNKRLWGCKIWLRLHCKPDNNFEWKLPAQLNRLKNTITPENVKTYMNNVLHVAGVTINESEDAPVEVILAELYSKSFSQSQVFQLIVLNKVHLSVTFYDISKEMCNQKLCPTFPFKLKLEDNSIQLSAFCDEDDKTYTWLSTTLLSQVVKWCEETSSSSYNQSICKESLALVPQNQYYSRYNKLKEKYGKAMVKIWPECTDPSKFVYEDIAIATYLLLLWDDEECQTKKQRFVDLGCGNGLLVYILTKEGHSGVGIDVRKRNIWDIYTEDVILEEKTIVPSDSSLFPNTDWIIGNHSDELTPWIPVIAAKSSYECNFFLLPCCAYNFDGTKYQRKNSFKSQYTDFLEHIKNLTEECGFNVQMDRLKIPSTKRICLVSKGRSYSKESYEDYCSKIQDIITHDYTPPNTGTEAWVKDFKARDPIERVRNCTQIDKNLIESIVKCIANYLLEDFTEESTWYGGRTVDLSKLIPLLPQDQLKQLKSECGGIQTLLKNNHNIFKVQSGKVQLRYPQTVDEVCSKNKSANFKIQQKPCWFYTNHPQGCPLLDTKCSFLHVKSY